MAAFLIRVSLGARELCVLFLSSLLLFSLLPHTSRGQAPDFTVIDEAAYAPEEVAEKVVVPLLTRDLRVLLFISSPGPANSWFTRVLDRSDPRTGGPLFRLIEITPVCRDCRRRDAALMSCEHGVPMCRDKNKESLLQAASMYDLKDKAKVRLMEQELLGLQGDDESAVFSTEELRKLFPDASTGAGIAAGTAAGTAARWRSFLPREIPAPDAPVRFFVGVDPSGGGRSSDTAIIVAIHGGATLHLVHGAHCRTANIQAVNDLLLGVVDAVLTSDPRLATFPVEWVMVPERAEGNEGERLAGVLVRRGLRTVCAYTGRGPTRRFGVVTDGITKPQYVPQAKSAIAVGSVALAADTLMAAETRASLREQLALLRWTGERQYSAKATRDGPRKDDFAMAFLILLFYWMRIKAGATLVGPPTAAPPGRR